MNNPKHLYSAALALSAAALLAACNTASPMINPTAASAEPSGAANSDGTTLKATAPNAVFPLPDATGVPVEAILTAQQAKAKNLQNPRFPHRFQVSESDSFATLVANDVGSIDDQGLVRFATPPLGNNKKVFWRVRAEQNDQPGPWSNVLSFTTTGPPTNTPTGPTTPTTPTTGNRPPDPAPGSRLPLPSAEALAAINRAAARLFTLPSCPNGRKYENNPWQDSLVDDLRSVNTRWGYNGKPTRTAADNSGFPVIAAGDEIAYQYGPAPDQGARTVYLIDTLAGHCGSTPSTTYRDFTGEEPGFWTGAGRFQGALKNNQ